MGGIEYAIHKYHDAHWKLPPAVVHDKDGKPLYSWRVLLLPYLEQEALFHRFKLDEPWDSPHNKSLLIPTPFVFRPRWSDGEDGTTHFQVLVGPGTAFERDGVTLRDFPDGRSNTILFVEATVPVPWTKPTDLEYDPNGPLPALGAGDPQPPSVFCRKLIAWRLACLADGTVRNLPMREDKLRAFITRNGAEDIDLWGPD
jgi:hypothetical protein